MCLKELNTDVEQPLHVFVNNQASFALSKNSMVHCKTKQIAFKKYLFHL